MSGPKTLIVIRHAKSSWKHSELEDIERPLNKRGARDAPVMGQRLLARSLIPDLIISSPAVRALTTAQVIADEVGFSMQKLVVDDELYACTFQCVLQVVADINDSVHRAILVVHNPAITDLANCVSSMTIENVPTCGILTIEASAWDRMEDGTLVNFDYPRKV